MHLRYRPTAFFAWQAPSTYPVILSKAEGSLIISGRSARGNKCGHVAA